METCNMCGMQLTKYETEHGNICGNCFVLNGTETTITLTLPIDILECDIQTLFRDAFGEFNSHRANGDIERYVRERYSFMNEETIQRKIYLGRIRRAVAEAIHKAIGDAEIKTH